MIKFSNSSLAEFKAANAASEFLELLTLQSEFTLLIQQFDEGLISVTEFCIKSLHDYHLYIESIGDEIVFNTLLKVEGLSDSIEPKLRLIVNRESRDWSCTIETFK